MNKKVAGAVIAITAVALIGAGAVYILNQDDYIVEQPPVVQEEVVDVQVPENDTSIIENIEIDEEGNVTAIVDGEAFAADSVEDTRTDEEAAYDLGKELGLTDEEIAEVLGKPIPDSRVETNTNDNVEDNNNGQQEAVENNNVAEPENNQAVDNSNNEISNSEGNLTPGLKENKNNESSEGNVWTGEDPFSDVNNYVPEVEGTGEVIEHESDDHIKFQ